MNSERHIRASEWQSDCNPMLEYYDADFPSEMLTMYPENFDETTVFQGLAHDIPRYLELAALQSGPILELCCGTGRVAIPLAEAGHHVTAVDFSDVLLSTLSENQVRVAAGSKDRLRVIRQDVTTLDLGDERFAVAIIAFNSLLCIPDFRLQRRVLARVAHHLSPRGVLVLDLVNPLTLPLGGDPRPTPFFTRRHPRTGRRYTRFSMLSGFDATQAQRLHGWYDEIDDEGIVRRRAYDTTWRPIFRFELELMLELAGFTIESLEGGHCKETYTPTSPRMFVQARKQGDPS
ncbi:MAG: class I SAM-dependent methyltransferase [bacterium]|nr:class I SAM-dependent methyltransferase [bacterium]